MTDRAGISSALTVDGVTYLVDCGRSAVTQYQRAGLAYGALNSIFLTHLHSDHVADYYNFFLLGGVSGAGGNVVPQPVRVFGPPSAGALPPVAGGGPAPVVHPTDPVPGTRAMTQYLHAAYAYSNNVYIRENPAGTRDIEDLAAVTELSVPPNATPTNTAPTMQPFSVFEDDRIRVTSILVPHGNVFPSYAYRFDTDYGSVTFSGDTRPSGNLVRLAQGTSLLVHEAISLPGTGIPPAFVEAMRADHTLVDEVGAIAQRADTPRLALSHVVDFSGTLNARYWARRARRNYSGEVTVGRDLKQLALGRKPTC